MTIDPLATVDWAAWRDRWERQQGTYIRHREDRFEAILDAVEAIVGTEFVALDIASGPGAIARRVVERFPKARVIAVELDPVLIEIGRRTLGDAGGRVTWREVDLNDATWPTRIGVDRVDAALSTTAIHWLSTGAIAQLYRTLASVIRPGGMFADGDQMRYAPSRPTLQRLADDVRARHRDQAHTGGTEAWDEWWTALRREPELTALFEERDRRFAWRGDADRTSGSQAVGAAVAHTGLALHQAALIEAGFAEVDTIWQEHDNRILAAVR